MSRDYMATMLPASFKGYPFRVEQEAIDNGGRYIVTHEYVRSERHDTEDTGRKTLAFSVKAYLASDAIEGDAAAFLEVLSSKGRGMLVLPVLGVHLVECTDIRRSSDKSKLGLVTFDLKFVSASESYALPVLGLAGKIAFSSAGSLARLVASTLSAALPGSSASSAILVSRAADVAIAATELISALPTFAPALAGSAPVDFDVRLSRSALLRAATAEDLAAAVLTVTEFVHDHATIAEPAEMQSAGLSLAASILSALPATTSPGLIEARRLGSRLVQGLALLFVAEAAAAACARSYAYRAQASEARAALVAAFDVALGAANEVPEETVAEARLSVSEAIKHLDETAANLAPLVRVQLEKSVPSTALAWALYRDPERAPELVAAAQTGTSLFMPQDLIVSAR